MNGYFCSYLSLDHLTDDDWRREDHHNDVRTYGGYEYIISSRNMNNYNAEKFCKSKGGEVAYTHMKTPRERV